jgi:hypothetical protein
MAETPGALSMVAMVASLAILVATIRLLSVSM